MKVPRNDKLNWWTQGHTNQTNVRIFLQLNVNAWKIFHEVIYFVLYLYAYYILRGLDRWRIHINMKAKIFQKYILINIGFVKIILHKLYLGISMQQALSRTMQVGRYTISRTNHWCGNKDILQAYILTMLETTIHEQHSFLFTATFEGCQLSFCVVKRKWINYFKSIIIYSSFVVIYLSFAWK